MKVKLSRENTKIFITSIKNIQTIEINEKFRSIILNKNIIAVVFKILI